MAAQLPPLTTQHHFNPLGFAEDQAIHQGIGPTELEPMAFHGAAGAKTVATILRLLGITGRPRTLQQDHLRSPLQAKA